MHNLEFRGRWIDIFGNVLLISILTTITLGIYAPWGYARYRRIIATQTFYEDSPLQFDGTGGQAFVEFLIIAVLSIVTLGLYIILGGASNRLLRWQYAHTVLPTGQRLEYRGDAIDLFFEYFLLGFFSILTLGIYFFWGTVRVRRYILSHTFLDGKSLGFEGTGGQYFIIWLVNSLLTIITFGIYAFAGFATVRLLRWDARNTLVPMPDRASHPMPVHSPTVSALHESAATQRTRTADLPQQEPPPASASPYSSVSAYETPDQPYESSGYSYPQSEEPYEDQRTQYDPQQYTQRYEEYEERGYNQSYEEPEQRQDYEEQTYDEQGYRRQPYDERYEEQQYEQWYNDHSGHRYDPRYQEEYDTFDEQAPPRPERLTDEDEDESEQRGYRS